MAELVPLGGGARSRLLSRRISATSDPEGSMESGIAVAKAGPFSNKKMGGKRKRSTPARLPPDLIEEVFMEILSWLPVKTIMRCRSVCKAWRAIISDPIFVRAHLQHSEVRWLQDPCFIISPQDYVIPEEEGQERWPTTFSNHVRFYQWREGNKAATFMHAKDFGYHFNQLHYFGHCDGLVLAPTDTSLHVFNPATRDVITLPESSRNNLPRRGGRRGCYCVGLGLDPRIGKYKVVQGFYWSADRTTMGMQVCTIANDDHHGIWCWRDIRNDPPYLLDRCQTALSINGYLFWRVAEPKNGEQQQPPRALVHLSLDDEEFGVTRLPDSLDPSLDYTFLLDVLHGGRELCLTDGTSETMLTIWTLPVADKGIDSPWEHRYTINVSGLFQTMALPPCSSGIILQRALAEAIYRYDLATCKLTMLCEMDQLAFQGRSEGEWKNLFTFDVKPYTESLVRITNRRQ